MRIGSIVWDVLRPDHTRQVIGDIWDAYRLEDGEFLLQSSQGYICIGRLTGKHILREGTFCPTIHIFEIETYAQDGVALGRRGREIYSTTLATRPENLPAKTYGQLAAEIDRGDAKFVEFRNGWDAACRALEANGRIDRSDFSQAQTAQLWGFYTGQIPS